MGIGWNRCALILAMSSSIPAMAQSQVVPVAEDASVNAANADGQLGNITTRGGLLAGLDDTGSSYSFYLKFLLPVPTEPLTKATLRGFYNDDFGGPPTFVGAFFVPDDSWSESTITHATAPATGGEAGGVYSADLTVGQFFELDVTPVAKTELAGDRVLSLGLMTIDGRFGDLKFFASKEFDPALAFSLTLDSTPIPPAVPLPSAVVMGSVGMLLAWGARRRMRPRSTDHLSGVARDARFPSIVNRTNASS